MALPHHAQPMPVDWKQRRRVRVVEYTLCSEDGSLVYSTCLERGRKMGLVPRAEHVLCSVPGRHHNRTHPAWVNADSACGLTLCALCTAQCMLCQHHVWLLLQRRSTKWHDSPPFLPGHVHGHQPSAGPRPPIPMPTPCHGGHPKTWYPSPTVCQHVDAEPQQAVLARVAVLGTFWYKIA